MRVAIPDGDAAGIRRTLQIDQTGPIRGLTVRVDISHPYVGDLKLTLTTPTGRSIVLYNQAYSSAPDLVQDFTAANVPALASLNGQPARGQWALTVADLAAGDSGVLRSWSIEIQLSGAAGFAEDALDLVAVQPSYGIDRLAADMGRFFADMSRMIDLVMTNAGSVRRR